MLKIKRGRGRPRNGRIKVTFYLLPEISQLIGEAAIGIGTTRSQYVTDLVVKNKKKALHYDLKTMAR